MQPCPTLPPELEYQIFLFAFQKERTRPINLLLVAKRVHDWLIPRIYEILVFRGGRARPNVAQLRTYGHHTRHLILTGVIPISVTEMLSYFPNVVNLAIWARSWLQDFGVEPKNPLTSLRLKRLSIHLEDMKDINLESTTNHEVKINENIKRFLSNITHLDCSKAIGQRELTALTYCTSLTHLCIFDTLPTQDLRWVFDVCNNLEVLIWLITRSIAGVSHTSVVVVKDERLRATFKDCGLRPDDLDKIALIGCNGYGDDWERGARGGVDMWALADREVKNKREVSWGPGLLDT
ncbi:hypothetical protein BDN72DRAFT_843411 [Pluteus cervinus]|uniref:Uncharacterized protein n=1 Tax=Pluteus cervinus TaxID=181527 RepID=A0ACD3AQH2_9AGAR|nr:hypothetical protein BDN72DRAFT_843411 [Pluteus cervinus]